MPNWCAQRFVIAGKTAAEANAFVDDFERAFHASAYPPEPAGEMMTIVGPHPGGSFTTETTQEEAYHASLMGGAFLTHPESVMPSFFPSELQAAPVHGPRSSRVVANPKVQRATGEGPIAYIGFKGKWVPSYEAEQLATISRAYPGLIICFDHAEQREGHAGRFICRNGRVAHPTPQAMAGVFASAGFQELVARSG